MGLFGRRKPEMHSVQYTHGAVIVESSDKAFVAEVINAWEANHGTEPAPPEKPKIGFDSSHMGAESDTELQPQECECPCGGEEEEE